MFLLFIKCKYLCALFAILNIIVKILISQQEYLSHRRFKYDALERAYYNFLSMHHLIPMPNINKVAYNDYDCLILTGGPDSIARNNTENILFNHALKKGVPIIGICHGAFAINDIAGGANGQIDGHVDKDIKIELEGRSYNVKCYHSQSVERLADNYEVTATDIDGTIEAFQHVTKPIYGIVWHPERMEEPVLPSAVRKILF
jgi:putative glutamine amidotransferase